MGLLDDLRAFAEKVDPSLLPTSNEVGGLLGALVYRVEHGEGDFNSLADKEPQEISDHLSGANSEPEPDTPTASAGNVAGPNPSATLTPAPGTEQTGTPAPPLTDPSPTPSLAKADTSGDQDLEAQIAALQDRLAAQRATSNQTTVEHQAGAEAPKLHSPGSSGQTTDAGPGA